jgi:hypothetical protein
VRFIFAGRDVGAGSVANTRCLSIVKIAVPIIIDSRLAHRNLPYCEPEGQVSMGQSGIGQVEDGLAS